MVEHHHISSVIAYLLLRKFPFIITGPNANAFAELVYLSVSTAIVVLKSKLREPCNPKRELINDLTVI